MVTYKVDKVTNDEGVLYIAYTTTTKEATTATFNSPLDRLHRQGQVQIGRVHREWQEGRHGGVWEVVSFVSCQLSVVSCQLSVEGNRRETSSATH